MINVDFIRCQPNEEYFALAHWADHLLPESWLKKVQHRDFHQNYYTPLGRLLLFRRLTLMGFSPNEIPAMKYTTAGKPYFENNIHFSFSYEKGLISVATSDKQAVGIDIEHIRPVTLEEYEAYFEAEEWMKISRSKQPVRDLINAWVTKEAATKLEGQVNIPISRNQIKFNSRNLRVDGKKYHHQSIPLPTQYIARLVSKKRIWRMKTNDVTNELQSKPMLYALRA